MLRTTVELVAKGVEARKRTLATMDIANDGAGDPENGNYVGTLYAEYTGSKGRRGKVTAFKRQKQSVRSLVGAFLKLFGHTRHPLLIIYKNLIIK